MASRHELKRYRTNLADELDSAALYETLSRVEKDPQRRTLFTQLASAERVHANLWANKLHANGARVPPHRYSLKTHLMRGLIHTLGPKFVLPSLNMQTATSTRTSPTPRSCRRTSSITPP